LRKLKSTNPPTILVNPSKFMRRFLEHHSRHLMKSLTILLKQRKQLHIV
jgi:predicted Rossmann-fold nucleotide-binding protein